jgi:DNA mismatch endonuclease, patch repair protein
MSAIRGKNTRPEIAVRRELHAAGYRFRLYRRDLAGNPDVVLPKYQMAVFVHGCFWHGHGCKRAKLPTTNTSYWSEKRERNQARDSRSRRMLRSLGWQVAIIWTCQQESDTKKLLRRLARTAR